MNDQFPLVSCVMVTGGRLAFAVKAVEYFRRQRYAVRELIIVDDGQDGLAAMIDDPRIRVIQVPPGQSIGAKRNTGLAAASGDVVVLWDDDDWYGPDRIEKQVRPIIRGQADITALTDITFFELASHRGWRCSPALQDRIFVEGVAAGTMAFSLPTPSPQFPNTSLREDADFLVAAMNAGARLKRVSAEGLFLYVRHGANTWSFSCGSHGGSGWEMVEAPALLAKDDAFYRRFGTAAKAQLPLVTCLVPTADRLDLLPRAIESFERQSYPHRELLILDDGEQSASRLVDGRGGSIRYVRLHGRVGLGEKRNLGCELARGEIIAHFDDDDWSAPDRVSAQVAILQGGVGVCGSRRLPYLDTDTGAVFRYEHPPANPPFLAGNTLAYTKSTWQRRGFRSLQVGEDADFVRVHGHTALDCGRSDLVVGAIHSSNTSPKTVSGGYWQPTTAEQLPPWLDDFSNRWSGAQESRSLA